MDTIILICHECIAPVKNSSDQVLYVNVTGQIASPEWDLSSQITYGTLNFVLGIFPASEKGLAQGRSQGV